jgi:hypothetical protein
MQRADIARADRESLPPCRVLTEALPRAELCAIEEDEVELGARGT